MNAPQTSLKPGFREITPREAREKTPSSALFLDVRTPAEFEEIHIDGAVLHPLHGLDPAEVEKMAAGKSACVVICESGTRARQAAAKLAGGNIPGLGVLAGGMQAWMYAGLSVVRGPRRVLPLMRQVQIAVGFISAVGAALALAVNPAFAIIPLITGCGLLFAGLTGFCGLALLLARMPWNQGAAGGAQGSCCENPR